MSPSGGRTWFTIALICCHIPFLFVQAFLHNPRSTHNHHSIGKRDVLTSASWIWTANPTTGNVAFLKTMSSPAGKTATSAIITLTAVNQFTLYINQQPIGASGADNWKAGQAFSVDAFSASLNASTNTVAVLAVNNNDAGAPAPGFLASIQVTYSDGSSDTTVSDASWSVSATIPSTFPTVPDTSNFGAATVLALFGSGSWGSSVTVSSPPSNSAILSGSQWIWSTSTAATDAATGTVGFRRTVITPAGKSAQSATVLITVDNGFSFYVGDTYVGTPPPAPVVPDFRRVQQFTVDLSAASNVFTIFGSNIPDAGTTDAGPAGVVASITILHTDGSTAVVGTDTNWLCGPFTSVSAFLPQPDSALTAAFALGTMGVSPWGQMTGISNALAAVNVPSGPFASGTVPTAPASGGNTTGGVSQASAQSSATSTSSTAGGTSSATNAASTPNVGTTGVSTSSASETQDVSAPDSSGVVAPSSPDNDNTAGSSKSTISIGLVVGVVVGVLALIGVGVVLFCWRRRARGPTMQALGSEIFDPANNVHSPVPSSQRTSMTSLRHPEMAVAPSASYSYPRPPLMVQGAYVQPPPVSYQQPSVVYQQQPPVAYQQAPPVAYQQPSPVVYQQQPPAAYQQAPPVAYQQPSPAAHQQPPPVAYNEQSSAYGGMLPDSRSATPQPTVAEPLSKLAREDMIWQRNAAASSAHTSVEVGSSAIAPTRTQVHSRGPSSVDLYGDTETLAPPSYYAE
ncbi:hypothetical protein B0H16DRAFT_1878890 [Mycena metata]|uniref:Uncharacterized protein n=1 Tax=Mycena metata TaxID=1033252 RepID=A0AAD7K4H4_9AGAR|nr:hypothetical protein B0H16DRAFT_1878890 [Mycena metata]